jgi:hypothetical protein
MYGGGVLILNLEKFVQALWSSLTRRLVADLAAGPIEVRNRAGRVADRSAASKCFRQAAQPPPRGQRKQDLVPTGASPLGGPLAPPFGGQEPTLNSTVSGRSEKVRRSRRMMPGLRTRVLQNAAAPGR